MINYSLFKQRLRFLKEYANMENINFFQLFKENVDIADINIFLKNVNVHNINLILSEIYSYHVNELLVNEERRYDLSMLNELTMNYIDLTNIKNEIELKEVIKRFNDFGIIYGYCKPLNWNNVNLTTMLKNIKLGVYNLYISASHSIYGVNRTYHTIGMIDVYEFFEQYEKLYNEYVKE